MNATQEINGKLYERVPVEHGRCTGCAFLVPKGQAMCGILGSKASCTQPELAIFVLAHKDKAVPEPDEQCGVGNG